jgi:hypothetical protein
VLPEEEVMLKRATAAIVCVSFSTLILAESLFAAEKPKQIPPAPIPAQILTAKRVFVGNAGGDEHVGLDEPSFMGGPQRTYDEFYAAMREWGRYELVGAPADADLHFEIGLTEPAVAGVSARGDTLTEKPYDPQFRLVIRDPKTHALLWAFTEHVPWAILRSNREKNFEEALQRIVNDVQVLAARSAPAASSAQP